MPITTLFKQLLQPTAPQVRHINTVANGTGLTTYTFTGGAHGLRTAGGNFGSHENVILENPGVPSPSRKGIYLLIASFDAATVFSVSSATIGGVAGTELIDRGGATVNVSSAIYGWSDSALAGITSFDIVITFSEAISACGAVLVEVANIRSFGLLASGSGTTSTNDFVDIDVTGIIDVERTAGTAVILAVTSMVNDQETDFQLNPAGVIQDAFHGVVITPTTIALGSARFAAGYYLVPSVNGHNDDTIQNIRVLSNGNTSQDAVAIALA